MLKRISSDIAHFYGYFNKVQDFGVLSSVDSFKKHLNDEASSSGSTLSSSTFPDQSVNNMTLPTPSHRDIRPDSGLTVGYRINPSGMTRIQFDDLVFTPHQLDLFIKKCQSVGLGLSRYRRDLSIDTVCESSSIGRGIKLILLDFQSDIPVTKVIVELFTQGPIYYGRYIALVILGLGCTVWYVVEPVSTANDTVIAGGDVLNQALKMDNFTHLDYQAPGFNVAKYVEVGDVSAVVESVMKEKPLTDLNIPVSGLVLKAVGLGLMLALAVAIGVEPTASTWS